MSTATVSVTIGKPEFRLGDDGSWIVSSVAFLQDSEAPLAALLLRATWSGRDRQDFDPNARTLTAVAPTLAEAAAAWAEQARKYRKEHGG